MLRISLDPRRALLPWLLTAAMACAPGPAPVETPAPALDVATAIEAAATITPTGVGREVHAIAHDSTMGRDTPSPELEKVARYLEHRFQTMGLEPGGDDGTFLRRWDYDVIALDREETRVRVVGDDQPGPTY
jgi:hypothetical protein